MGRSKPRTNKRPPPRSISKPLHESAATSPQTGATPSIPSSVHPSPNVNVPSTPSHLSLPSSRSPSVPSSQSQPRSPLPGQRVSSPSLAHPHAPISVPIPSDADLSSALHTWSTSALGRIDALPKLTQSQLSAIAGAAAGVGEHQGGLPIDLPASLAALFEAKLTLDREKAKLVRMQKELKGYRDGVLAVSGGPAGSPNANASASGSGSGSAAASGSRSGSGSRSRSNQNGVSWGAGLPELYSAASKGKGVASDMDECLCGQRHSPVYEEYSEDEECYDCECDCHYVECEHEHEHEHPEDCDCDCDLDYDEHEHYEDDEYEYEDDHDQHHHSHNHDHQSNHHNHQHNHSLSHSHNPTNTQAPLQHQHQHQHSHHSHGNHNDNTNGTQHHTHNHPHGHPQHTCEPVTIPNPYLQKDSQLTYQQALEAYRDERDSAVRGLDEIGGMFKAAGWQPRSTQPPKPLSEDPERLDEAVRELFNWIKAVVWTIEQAAIVAGRRRT